MSAKGQKRILMGFVLSRSEKSGLFLHLISLFCANSGLEASNAKDFRWLPLRYDTLRVQCRTIGNGNLPLHPLSKSIGSAFSVNVVVPAPSLTWQGQSLASYADKGESGKPLSRKFCRNCGSSLATETEALPGAIIIKAGTLDDKSWLKPNYHLWTNSAQPWVRIEPGAKTFPKGRT